MLNCLYIKFKHPLTLFIKIIKNSPFSALAVVLIAILLVLQSYRIGTWRTNRSIIHDITSYYSYLPAAIIYKDFEFNYRYSLPENEPLDHVWVNTRGDSVFQKMSIGLAYFYSPTFILAHWYTKNFTAFNANGFSKPYQMAMNINTLIFGLLGLLVCWMLCRKLFNDVVAAICLICLYAGTNLLYYISGAPGLSHPYSFLLISLIYLLSILFYTSPKRYLLFIISILIGLAVLVRPTNAILCLFPLLYGFSHKKVLIKLLSDYRNYLLFCIGFAICWIPQFIYWKYASGHFFFYSYDEEGFFFSKPHILDGLFSYRKGWLLYTPMMAFAIIGLFINKRNAALKKPLIMIFPIFLFVVFSWWCWWYGGSFGSRVMIESYPLLIVGLGGFIEYVIRAKWLFKIPLGLCLIFCIYLNFNQTWQYSLGMLHWDSMSKNAYWSIFLKETPPDNFQELLEHPDYKTAMKEGE